MIYIHEFFLNSNITSRNPVWVEAEVAHVENKGKEGKNERSIQDARKEDTNDQEDAGDQRKNDNRGDIIFAPIKQVRYHHHCV